uniref:transmembrane and immunoglobulin domain-containing protein 2-like n=1 Tax=Gasterosteus aculeatus aculeatus TaxID=481459 RepID=UPI001A9996EA|nr:transmembrane and immunoglobulin domain-containing protein 2-like [Gasterosteus aculeatus aculeatus]
MKLLLSSLLLASFCALSSWSVSSAGEPAVSQTPDVSVVEGETAEISCCWTLEYQKLRVTWLKNHTEIKSKMIFKNSSHGSLSDKTSYCSHLTLMNVARDDSGRYICEVTVEIPNLNKAQGVGTVLTVTAKDNTTGSHWEEVPVYVLRSLPLLALILAVLFITFLVRKAQQQTPAAPQNQHTPARR